MVLGLLIAAHPVPATALSVVFDYRYDRSGFFDPTTPTGALARTTLETAAAAFASLADPLLAIAPSGDDHWSAGFFDPGASGFGRVDDLAVPAGSLVVFVGARPLAGALAFASGGTILAATGSLAFADTLAARGQTGALLPSPTDVGPWGGSITFNTNVPWHLDATTAPGALVQDLLATATHELAHLLGIGDAGSWQRLVADGDDDPATAPVFLGTASTARYGGPVPLDVFGGHFAEGVASRVGDVTQETLMDPTTPRGTREALTDLDLAALSDVGWHVVPEPGAAALVALGVGVLATRRRDGGT